MIETPLRGYNFDLLKGQKEEHFRALRAHLLFQRTLQIDTYKAETHQLQPFNHLLYVLNDALIIAGTPDDTSDKDITKLTITGLARIRPDSTLQGILALNENSGVDLHRQYTLLYDTRQKLPPNFHEGIKEIKVIKSLGDLFVETWHYEALGARNQPIDILVTPQISIGKIGTSNNHQAEK